MTSILCQSSNNKHVCYCLRIATDNNLLCLAAYPCTASNSAVRLTTLTALYIYTNFPWKDYYTNRLIFCCLATTLQTSFILLLVFRQRHPCNNFSVRVYLPDITVIRVVIAGQNCSMSVWQ